MAQDAIVGAARAVALARRAVAASVSWLLPAAGLAGGVVLGSCVVPAAAELFTLSAFHDRMDRDAPHSPVEAALRCIVAGGASMAGAAVLAVFTTAIALGWWAAPARNAAWSLAALLIMYFVSLLRAPVHSIGRGSALVLGAAAIAVSSASPVGVECVYAAVAALVLVRAGWVLMRDVASELLRQAR